MPAPAAAAPSPGGPSHLLYLHGFRSSPRSAKAQAVARWLAAHQPDVHFWCPQLPASPRQAMALLLDGSAGWPGWPGAGSAVIGSSLGGFYAHAVAVARSWPAALINPAVHPARDLAAHVGAQTAFHDPAERFFFDPAFIGELRAIDDDARAAEAGAAAAGRAGPLLLVAATGDEVLDWREMAQRHSGATLHRVDGSDHALSDFDAHLPAVLRFLHLAP